MTLPSDAFVNGLILDIYHAAEDPTLWSVCLEKICAVLDGRGAVLLHQDRSARSRDILWTQGFDPEASVQYSAYFNRLDPWGLALSPEHFVDPPRVFDGRELVPAETVPRTEYYADFGRRFGCVHAVFALLEPHGDRSALITINRGDSQEAFDEEARRFLGLLAPHVRQALRFHRRLTDIDGLRAVTCELLDQMPLSIVLVDERGAPVFANAAASGLAARRVLTLHAAGIRLLTPRASRRLGDALRAAFTLNRGEIADGRTLSFSVSLGGDARQLFVSVVPLQRHAGSFRTATGAVAAVCLRDASDAAIDDVGRLSGLFSLTPAETAVAAHLAAGQTIAEVAEAMHLSRNTIRTHVAHVLDKAGVRTQAQFVSLVLRGPATLRRPSA